MVDGFEPKLTTPTNQHALVGQMFIFSNWKVKHLQNFKIFEHFEVFVFKNSTQFLPIVRDNINQMNLSIIVKVMA